jgi:hypothetical protein
MTAGKRAAAAALGVLLMLGLSGCPGGGTAGRVGGSAGRVGEDAGRAVPRAPREIPPVVKDVGKEIGSNGLDAAGDVARDEADPDPTPQYRRRR